MNLNKMIEERIKYFYDNVEIEDEGKERAERAIYSKGIEKHIIILDNLKPWFNEDKIKYELVASIYRYDKRLRTVLFKFISYLEEYYRAIILDYFGAKSEGIEFEVNLRRKLEKFGNMNNALEEIEFSTLLNQCLKLKDVFTEKYLFPETKYLTKNVKALVTLRNSVMHNKLILLYRQLEECYISDDVSSKSTTLKDNIINLINFLPKDVREKCKTEINACKEERDNIGKTKWYLPSFVIISID